MSIRSNTEDSVQRSQDRALKEKIERAQAQQMTENAFEDGLMNLKKEQFPPDSVVSSIESTMCQIRIARIFRKQNNDCLPQE